MASYLNSSSDISQGTQSLLPNEHNPPHPLFLKSPSPRNSSDAVIDIELIASSDGENSSGLRLTADFDKTKFSKMVKSKSVEDLQTFGGLKNIPQLLKTNIENGIKGDEVDLGNRKLEFGYNTYTKPSPKGFFCFILESFKDNTIIILLAGAAITLVIGISKLGLEKGWYEGGSTIMAVLFVMTVYAACNFYQARKLHKKQLKTSNDMDIDVMRGGMKQKALVLDIVVGDIVFLTSQDQVPADGLFIDGDTLRINESSMTGGSDNVEVNSEDNPFLLSGSKVVEGCSRMVVTSVGGEMMSTSTSDSNEYTPVVVSVCQKISKIIWKLVLTVATQQIISWLGNMIT